MGRFTQLNHKTNVKNQYRSLFSKVVTLKLSYKQYLEYRDKIQKTNSYKRLTQYNREYIRGMEELFIDRLYKHLFDREPFLAFCCDVDGTRYDTRSAEYKQLSPVHVSKNHTWRGMCWKEDISKVWC